MRICFLDIETTSLIISEAKIKFVGIIDAQNNNFYFIDENNLKELPNLLTQYDKVITYNGTSFDLPILEKYGINLQYWQNLDLYLLMKKRATLLYAKGFPSLSLANVIKKIFPDGEQKLDIDYKIFQKDFFTEEELLQIKVYLERDLKLTKKLWDYLVTKFESFGEFISPEDRRKLQHITSSTASYGYKALCYAANIPENWGDVEAKQDEFTGAYVMQPPKEFARGNILYLDYASLYPQIIVHNNLFNSKCNCCSQDEKWHGNERWKVDGYYCKKNKGKLEDVIKKLYLLRKEYKKNKNPAEQAIKIILNSLYGSASRKGFEQTYSEHCAGDTCLIGQQIIKYSIKQLEENGFGMVVMSDTDSIVIELAPNKTKEECLEFTRKLAIEISNSFPFPWPEEFNLKLECEPKYIQFFRGDDAQLLKKNYLYINEKNNLTIKGLDIIQRDCSQLSQLIYEKYLKQQIIEKLDCKFPKKYIEELVYGEIEKDKLLLAKKFTIKSSYESKTTLYNDILQNYGSGEQFLIKNFKLGIGKGVKYCSLEEAKNLTLKDFDLTDIWRELSPFTKIINLQKTLF